MTLQYLAIFFHLHSNDFSMWILVAGSKFSEGLLLGLVPVFIESPLAVLIHMFCPCGHQCPEPMWSLYIPSCAYTNQGRGLQDGHSINHFLLVYLGSRLVNLPYNMGHPSFVCHEGSKMNWSLWVIFWERLYLATISARPLPWVEGQGSMSGRTELPVRHSL